VPTPPACPTLGRHCRELAITLRIASTTDDTQTLQDAAATWLLGHREHLSFGRLHTQGEHLQVHAVLHVPCRHLLIDGGNGNRGSATLRGNWTGQLRDPLQARCLAYGYAGVVPGSARPSSRSTEIGGNGKFPIVYQGTQRALELPLKRDAVKTLPVLHSPNPCVGVPCRTADNRRGAACCRDLSLEVVVPEADTHTAALLRARKSPYLCKVSRTNPEIIECEVISACGHLEDDGLSCALHDRRLPNGRPAKPSICSEWPDLGPNDVGHPGCRLL
jgi:hypothetical protein